MPASMWDGLQLISIEQLARTSPVCFSGATCWITGCTEQRGIQTAISAFSTNQICISITTPRQSPWLIGSLQQFKETAYVAVDRTKPQVNALLSRALPGIFFAARRKLLPWERPQRIPRIPLLLRAQHCRRCPALYYYCMPWVQTHRRCVVKNARAALEQVSCRDTCVEQDIVTQHVYDLIHLI